MVQKLRNNLSGSYKMEEIFCAEEVHILQNLGQAFMLHKK